VTQIGTADGLMERSDLLTHMYLLAAIYADGADRRRIAREQGSMDMKEFFTDLKIRLEGSFTLTKEQTVIFFYTFCLIVD
jgi:hypothetical protein